MKIFKITLLSLLVLAVVSCGPQVNTTKTSNVDLSKYKTFAYLPNANAEVKGEMYDDENVNTVVVETVKSQLMKEGYTLNRNNPDLLVLISTKIDQEKATETEPVYSRYPYSNRVNRVGPYYNNYYYNGYNSYNGVVGYDTDTYSYKEGTLVINLIDKETKKTVWKGVASDNIYKQSTDTEITQMIDDIFKEYPMK